MTHIFAFFYTLVALISYEASVYATHDTDHHHHRLDPNDPKIVELAKYALAFINEVRPDEPQIEFVKVIQATDKGPNLNAEKNPCAIGKSYKLKISTKIKGNIVKRHKTYWARVYEDQMQLISFEEIKSPSVVSSEMTRIAKTIPWMRMDPKDAKVVEAGKFAVAEHNKKANTTLEFLAVVEAKRRGICLAMSLRKLVIFAKNDSSYGYYIALVWAQYRTVVWSEKDSGF